MSVDDTLQDRGKRYGEFPNNAQVSQDIQNVIINGFYRAGGDPTKLPAYILEALTMIAHKISRVVNGDPYYDDSWRDIAGYATLVVEELNKAENIDAEKKLQKGR